jgi:intracellular sulfur oxidation DsrE/DsrF family protein
MDAMRVPSARRSFVTAIGAALAAVGVGRGRASAQAASPGAFSPMAHPDDSFYDNKPARHRIVIDAADPASLPDALRFSNNLFQAHAQAYGLKDEDLGIIIVIRHGATMFGWDNDIWAKYGEVIGKARNVTDPDTKAAPRRNIYRAVEGKEGRGFTIDSQVARGVQIAVCGTATRGFSGQIAQATGQKQEDVYNEITARPMPSARFVPAGVLAVSRAQEHGYTLLYAG